MNWTVFQISHQSASGTWIETEARYVRNWGSSLCGKNTAGWVRLRLFAGHFQWSIDNKTSPTVFSTILCQPPSIRMTSECEHLPRTPAMAAVCFLSRELSALGQSSGRKQVVAPRATTSVPGTTEDPWELRSESKGGCRQFSEHPSEGHKSLVILGSPNSCPSHRSSVVLNAKAELHSFGPPEELAP